MKTAFAAVCNTLAHVLVGGVWLLDRLAGAYIDAKDPGGAWARHTAGEDEK